MKFKWQNILFIIFFTSWFFKYFIDILLGKFGFFLTLANVLIWIFLSLYALFLILKYLIADTTSKPKVKILLIIIPLLLTTLFYPDGLVNWEKFESKNLIVAAYTGTANCRTYLKIRANNVLKVSSYCFGAEHSWGKYVIKGDTIFFELPKDLGYIRTKGTFGILEKKESKKATINNICIYNTPNFNRCLSFKIDEQSKDFDF
ncbi:MAG: hypothetical protein IPN86_16175 [Saprospiraceae bacterium]|nr:hypothetical protein [Saprospiraceae bacterium]